MSVTAVLSMNMNFMDCEIFLCVLFDKGRRRRMLKICWKNMNKKLGCWNMHLPYFLCHLYSSCHLIMFQHIFFIPLQYCKWTLNLYFEAFTYEIFIQLPFNIHFYSHVHIFLFAMSVFCILNVFISFRHDEENFIYKI